MCLRRAEKVLHRASIRRCQRGRPAQSSRAVGITASASACLCAARLSRALGGDVVHRPRSAPARWRLVSSIRSVVERAGVTRLVVECEQVVATPYRDAPQSVRLCPIEQARYRGRRFFGQVGVSAADVLLVMMWPLPPLLCPMAMLTSAIKAVPALAIQVRSQSRQRCADSPFRSDVYCWRLVRRNTSITAKTGHTRGRWACGNSDSRRMTWPGSRPGHRGSKPTAARRIPEFENEVGRRRLAGICSRSWTSSFNAA
jgi:hypothetical protein